MPTSITSANPGGILSPEAVANAKAKGIGTGISIGANGQVSPVAPVAAAPKVPNAQPQAVASVDTSGVPADALTRLNSSGLTGQTLADAQRALAGHYAGAGGTQAPTPAQSPATQQPSATQPAPTASTVPTATGTTDGLGNAGILGRFIGATQATDPATQQAQQGLTQATSRQQQLQSDIAKQYGNIESQAIPLEFQQGREQALSRQYASQEAAAQSAVTQQQQALGQAVTERGQNLGALATAAGLAQPTPAAVGQTTFNPVTGQYEGGAGGLSQDVLQRYAQMAASGQLTQIPSTITSNPVLFDQVNQLAKQINPNYNPVLSAGSAQTQQLGQQASAAAPAAYQALDALQTAFGGLGQFTGGTGIPILNQLEQNVALSTGLGRPAVSAYQGALKEARAQVDAVLAPIIGVDAASAQANALLPDNMLPTELPQKISAAKTYIQQRIQSYTSSGQQAGQAPSSSSASSSGPSGGVIQTAYGTIDPSL